METHTICALLSVLALFPLSEGLKCRRDNDRRTVAEFEEIKRSCMKNQGKGQAHSHSNKDRKQEKGQPGKFGASEEEEYEYEEESEESEEKNRGEEGRKEGKKGKRIKRSRTSGSRTKRLGSPLEDLEPCTIHCIFRQKQMLKEDGKPDRSAVLATLTRRVKDPELKDFIEDSVHLCFETIEQDGVQGKCDVSKNFLLCLEERGKMNCDDWYPKERRNNRYT